MNLHSKVSDRIILFTDSCILKLNAKYKVLKQMSYNEVRVFITYLIHDCELLMCTSGADPLHKV